MRRLHTTVTKAVKQIERQDAQGAEQYRAELKYFHYKPRVVLSAPSNRKAMHYTGKPTWCCTRAFMTLGREHEWTVHSRDHAPA